MKLLSYGHAQKGDHPGELINHPIEESPLRLFEIGNPHHVSPREMGTWKFTFAMGLAAGALLFRKRTRP